MVRFLESGEDWDGALLRPAETFVTGIGAGTTYPDYKPAPFIVGAEHAGVDTVSVVTETLHRANDSTAQLTRILILRTRCMPS